MVVTGNASTDDRSRIVLHIGTHKTATTSFQRYLTDHREALHNRAVHIFDHRVSQNALTRAALRSDVAIPPLDEPQAFDREALQAEMRREILAFTKASGSGTYIFSSENLSLIRTDEECRALRSLFPRELPIQVVVTFRDPEEFLRSYRRQMIRLGQKPSTRRHSSYYTERDSWLVDYDTIRTVFRRNFDDFVELPYDAAGMLARLLPVVGIETPAPDRTYRKNRTPSRLEDHSRWHPWKKRIGRTPLAAPAVALLGVIRRWQARTRGGTGSSP